jgi:hypothetical protein
VSLWGPVTDGADVEAALVAHLRHWMPAAAQYVRRAKDPDNTLWPAGIADIREYGVSHADAAAQKWPEDQLPMLIAQSPGMEGDPFTEEEGNVSAVYGVVLSAIASSVTIADAKALARLYASAARLAIIQHPSLDAGTGVAFASHVAQGAERNGQVRRGIEGERNLMVCSVPYLIEVPTIMVAEGGPREVPDDIEVEPPEDPIVKEGGASATVDALTESGFFDAKPE